MLKKANSRFQLIFPYQHQQQQSIYIHRSRKASPISLQLSFSMPASATFSPQNFLISSTQPTPCHCPLCLSSLGICSITVSGHWLSTLCIARLPHAHFFSISIRILLTRVCSPINPALLLSYSCSYHFPLHSALRFSQHTPHTYTVMTVVTSHCLLPNSTNLHPSIYSRSLQTCKHVWDSRIRHSIENIIHNLYLSHRVQPHISSLRATFNTAHTTRACLSFPLLPARLGTHMRDNYKYACTSHFSEDSSYPQAAKPHHFLHFICNDILKYQHINTAFTNSLPQYHKNNSHLKCVDIKFYLSTSCKT